MMSVPSKLSFSACVILLIITVTFWCSCSKISLNLTPLLPKRWPISNCAQTSLNHRFKLVFWCLSPQRHFGAVTVKFSLNKIMTRKMVNFQNPVRRFQIIRFSWFSGAYHYSDILELLR